MTDKSVPKEQRILAAAEQVFSNKGYSQATLDEIIKIADTGKGTVYKYYKSKENLFYTLVCRKHQPFVEKINYDLSLVEDFEERLLVLFSGFISFFEINAVIWQVLFFDVTGGNTGWRLVRGSDGNYQPCVRWGKNPTQEQIDSVKKYMQMIYEELDVFIEVLQYGVDHGVIKAFDSQRLLEDCAGHLFGGIAMSVFHGTSGTFSREEFVKGIIKRFLDGCRAVPCK